MEKFISFYQSILTSNQSKNTFTEDILLFVPSNFHSMRSWPSLAANLKFFRLSYA